MKKSISTELHILIDYVDYLKIIKKYVKNCIKKKIGLILHDEKYRHIGIEGIYDDKKEYKKTSIIVYKDILKRIDKQINEQKEKIKELEKQDIIKEGNNERA